MEIISRQRLTPQIGQKRIRIRREVNLILPIGRANKVVGGGAGETITYFVDYPILPGNNAWIAFVARIRIVGCPRNHPRQIAELAVLPGFVDQNTHIIHVSIGRLELVVRLALMP